MLKVESYLVSEIDKMVLRVLALARFYALQADLGYEVDKREHNSGSEFNQKLIILEGGKVGFGWQTLAILTSIGR